MIWSFKKTLTRAALKQYTSSHFALSFIYTKEILRKKYFLTALSFFDLFIDFELTEWKLI